MKICMLLKNNDLAFDSRVRKEAATLAAAGHEVLVIAKKTERTEAHEFLGQVEVLRIPTCFWDPRRLFLEVAAARRADVYHGHDIYALDIAVVAARRTAAFAVYDSHELWTALLKDFWGIRYLRRFFYWLRERCLIGEADSVITVSDSIRQILMGKYRISDVTVLRNVPPPEVARTKKNLRRLLPVAEHQRIMVHVGGIGEDRGMSCMVEALGRDARLVLVCIGVGLSEDTLVISRLKKLASELGAEDRLHFLTAMPFEDMIAYASSADFGMCIIQHTNLHYYSTIANKFFEYILAGIPVIASDFPEMASIVEKYDLGVTVPPDNSDTLAGALKNLLDDSVKYARMKQNTRRALAENNWEIESRKLVELYERLSVRKPNSSPGFKISKPVISQGNILVLADKSLSEETTKSLLEDYGDAEITIVLLQPANGEAGEEKGLRYLPIRNLSDFLKCVSTIARLRISRSVTIYQDSTLAHFVLFDLLCLIAGAWKKYAYFPFVGVSYPIAANVFLHKYLNRIETKLYFVFQFAKVLAARRARDSVSPGRD